jgi:hypothetical protein
MWTLCELTKIGKQIRYIGFKSSSASIYASNQSNTQDANGIPTLSESGVPLGPYEAQSERAETKKSKMAAFIPEVRILLLPDKSSRKSDGYIHVVAVIGTPKNNYAIKPEV